MNAYCVLGLNCFWGKSQGSQSGCSIVRTLRFVLIQNPHGVFLLVIKDSVFLMSYTLAALGALSVFQRWRLSPLNGLSLVIRQVSK